MDVDQVRKATRNDPMLSRVLQFVMTGWPEKPIAPEVTLDEKMDLLMFANGANVLQIWSTKFELNLH